MNSDHWSEYWKQGNVTSLPLDFNGNYNGQILDFWNRQFQSLDTDSRIVDLCTGNGAIALLAAEFSLSRKKDFSIDAIDAAAPSFDITAQKHPTLRPLFEQITLSPNYRIESMPYEDNAFDIAISQFGIEYSNWPEAAKEISRILVNGGLLSFVSHDLSTDIIITMKEELKDYQFLDSINFFEAFRFYKIQSIDYQSFSSMLQMIKRSISQRNIKKNSPLLDSVYAFIDQIINLNKDQVDQYYTRVFAYLEELKASRQRLNDLIVLHERFQQTPNWIKSFETAGFVLLESGKLLNQSNSVGVYYCFQLVHG